MSFVVNLVVVLFLFLVGYFIIIWSVLHEPTPTDLGLSSKLMASNQRNIILQQELETLRNLKQQRETLENSIATDLHDLPAVDNKIAQPYAVNHGVRHGVIILGMHRSGTSVMGGLMNKMGLNTGGPLIGPAEDNKKGFFERLDVVLQNDEFMKKQGVHYAYHTFKYDALLGLKVALSDMGGGDSFKEGKRALDFLNNPNNYPWMLKDPRLCITFRTWLPLLNFVPAIIFAYRHPLDVAVSMHKREFEQFKISKVLKLWYVYNRRAIEQSVDLCRVVSSHRLMMTQPVTELDRIYRELRECGLDVPHEVSREDVDAFVDQKLQHGHATMIDHSCNSDLRTIVPPSESWPTSDPQHLALYRETMRVYCAMEDGTAFSHSFPWDQSIRDDM
jgi:hypothetical protein